MKKRTNPVHVFTELRTFDNSISQAMNPPGSVFEQIHYFKADWNTIVQELSSYNLENSIQHLNTEDALNVLVKTIGDICARNAPTKKCKNKNISLFFKHRKVLMRKRRKLTNRISKHGVIYRERIKEQLVNIELEILQSHKDENIHLENVAVHRIKTDPNYFFKYAKKLFSNTEVGPLLNASGDLVKDKKSMSNMLLKQFSSVFSSPSTNYAIKEPTCVFYDHDESNSSMSPDLTDITFTKDIVESTIKNLKTNFAPDPDGMTCEILAKCAPVISEPLATPFSKSLGEGSVPNLLKRAAVVSIFKGGDKSDPSNYRPVSLTPILIKLWKKLYVKIW